MNQFYLNIEQKSTSQNILKNIISISIELLMRILLINKLFIRIAKFNHINSFILKLLGL